MAYDDTIYGARLARLNAARKGDTVTIPDGWVLDPLADTGRTEVQA